MKSEDGTNRGKRRPGEVCTIRESDLREKGERHSGRDLVGASSLPQGVIRGRNMGQKNKYFYQQKTKN